MHELELLVLIEQVTKTRDWREGHASVCKAHKLNALTTEEAMTLVELLNRATNG